MLTYPVVNQHRNVMPHEISISATPFQQPFSHCPATRPVPGGPWIKPRFRVETSRSACSCEAFNTWDFRSRSAVPEDCYRRFTEIELGWMLKRRKGLQHKDFSWSPGNIAFRWPPGLLMNVLLWICRKYNCTRVHWYCIVHLFSQATPRIRPS